MLYSPARVKGLLAALALSIMAMGSAFAQESPVATAQRHLMSLSTGEMETSVSPEIRAALGAFKTKLAAQTDTVLSQLPVPATAAAVHRALAAALPAPSSGKAGFDAMKTQAQRGEADGSHSIAGEFGGELQIAVSQPQPSLLLVQESFDIACGNDTVLLVFRSEHGHWQRIATWQSKPYDEISGAFGDAYEARILRPRRDGNPLLLVVHGTPWCTSTMSMLHMDVLELSSSPMDTSIWHAGHDYRRADLDPPFTVKLTGDGFEVRTSVSSLDREGQVSRKGVMRYALIGNTIHRVEPIAMNAHDSVEEWLQMPRSEAKDFADDTPGSLSWKMFQEFTWEGRPKDAAALIASVGAVRACNDAKDHYQAEVTSERFDPSGKEKDRPGPAYFVQLKEGTNGYRVHTVTASTDAACGGTDLTGGSD